MNNKTHHPQTESLMDFWKSQQERLALLSGVPVTDDVVRLTAEFGECDLQAFERLMAAQGHLAALLEQTAAHTDGSVTPTVRRIPNPVIDRLDLSDPRTVRRFEIHSYDQSDAPRGDTMIPSFGTMLLVGRRDARTAALASMLEGKGLSLKWVESTLNEEEAEAWIARTAEEGPLTGLLLVANAYDEADMDECVYRHTMTAVYLIKHYTIYLRGLRPNWRGLVFFTTFLDGRMGYTGDSPHYAYGTFNGVAKTLSIEFGELADVKLIDFEPTVSPGRMVELAEDELRVHEGWPEIGRTSDGARWSANGIPTDSVVEEGRCPYGAEDVIVVTGGSRGVTAKCILALMEKAPCHLVILGRAVIREEHMDDEESAAIPDLKEMKTLVARRFKAEGYKGSFAAIEEKAKAILAQRDMLHTFRTLEATGCRVHYYACNVNDRESLAHTMEQVHREVGPVRGIIHGAGLLADCKIWNKDMARFRQVLDTKYRGLNNLLSCVDQEKLKLVVSFSSVAGYFGNDGQMDYAAGNEFLDKFGHYFRKRYPNCRSLTINWGAWDGGMMDYIYRKTLTEKGYVLIPLEVGANYFANEILNGLPYGQILISNNDKPVDATRPAE